MGTLELYDSFQPYSAASEPALALTAVKPEAVSAAKDAIERFRERHGRQKAVNRSKPLRDEAQR